MLFDENAQKWGTPIPVALATGPPRTWSLNSQLGPVHCWPAHPSLPCQSCRWTSPIPHLFPLASLFRSRSHHSKPTDRIPSSPPILLTHSASTSPASSLLPQTPGLIKVALAAWSPVEAPIIPHGHASISTSAKPKTVTVTLPRNVSLDVG